MQNCCACKSKQEKESKNMENSNAGSWSLDQNLEYAIFVDINKKSMTSKKKMREMSFYDKLSAFVGTRTSSQCRSHHQKLFEKYKYISKTIEAFRSQIPMTTYKTRLAEGIEKMKRINKAVRQPVAQRTQLAPQQPPLPMENPQSAQRTTVQYPFMTAPAAIPFPYVVPQAAWVPVTMPPYTILPGFWPQ